MIRISFYFSKNDLFLFAREIDFCWISYTLHSSDTYIHRQKVHNEQFKKSINIKEITTYI